MKTRTRTNTKVNPSPQPKVTTTLERHSISNSFTVNTINHPNSLHRKNNFSLSKKLNTISKRTIHNQVKQTQKSSEKIDSQINFKKSLGHSLNTINVSVSKNTIQPFKIPKLKIPKFSRKKQKYGALRLINRLKFKIPYIYRWGNGSWKAKTLGSNTYRWHSWKYQTAKPRSPNFQIRFDADLQGGKIDARTYSLKRYQSSGKPHQSAKKYQFTKVAARRLDLLPSEKVKDLKWKKVTVETGDFKTQRIKGTAFVKGRYDPHVVDPNDVAQGALGDCYLLAAMASLARANPDAIKRLIRPRGKGVYDVTIYVKSNPNAKPGEGKRTPTVITVNDTFPVSSAGQAAFAQKGDVNADGKPELWVMLIEKAYAIYKGSYADIEGGYPEEAMATLTGNSSSNYDTDKYTDKQVAKMIENCLAKNRPVTAWTKQMNETDKKQARTINRNIIELHAYSVKKVNVNSLTISLQNPWGRSHVNGLSMADFRRFYWKFQVG